MQPSVGPGRRFQVVGGVPWKGTRTLLAPAPPSLATRRALAPPRAPEATAPHHRMKPQTVNPKGTVLFCADPRVLVTEAGGCPSPCRCRGIGLRHDVLWHRDPGALPGSFTSLHLTLIPSSKFPFAYSGQRWFARVATSLQTDGP